LFTERNAAEIGFRDTVNAVSTPRRLVPEAPTPVRDTVMGSRDTANAPRELAKALREAADGFRDGEVFSARFR
jgi:hypothetical protein